MSKAIKTYEDLLQDKLSEVLAVYPGARTELVVKEQYRNMKEVLNLHPKVSELAKEAIARAGINVLPMSARGGTDGSRLSFMGLPCPNIFTGMQAIHSKHEWVGVRDMQDAVRVLVELVQVWEEKS